ncbi:hypothetical protein SISSUDRAFT_1060667 [Sistotremastrum suecicum HHB10207 ss-3]|uniref:DUF155 domain-containing protein n=1 Tax=Sistotremastrum suecicum HHB10207 ss-3 TaxID=1314776 RepID=A0A166EW33_9AGAM|nr:hypothetical protein SISSUDRAFT_1060667 [Sistotremastrum suecicum HHB10207 ss-3]
MATTSSQRNYDPPKPKPKATTSLRKSASASLPIRSNPTPTRSPIQSIFTLTTAEKYYLPGIREIAPEEGILYQDCWWIPRWGENNSYGEIFVFGNGSFVCWGLGQKEAHKFASQVIARPGIQLNPLKELETEDLEFVTDPAEPTRLQGDLIILGHTPPLDSVPLLTKGEGRSVLPAETLSARYAFSQALARSTALSALESALEDYLSSVALLPQTLSATGKPGLSRKELIKKLGVLMKFRQGLNLNHENFSDTPDFYWTEPILEGYFNSMSEALEIKGRTVSVNEKITYAVETQSLLRELLAESSGHRMELIIIALIAVEVVIAIIRDGPELWELLVKRDQSEAEVSPRP